MARRTPPTEEELLRMKTGWEVRRIEQEQRNRELSTKYADNVCRICGRRFMTGVVCRKWGGSACMKHCQECEHHAPMFGHCLYREPRKPWKTWATADSMKDLLQYLTQRVKRTCIVGEMDGTAAYRVIDAETGEIAKGRVRFLEGAWHYGTYEEGQK